MVPNVTSCVQPVADARASGASTDHVVREHRALPFASLRSAINAVIGYATATYAVPAYDRVTAGAVLRTSTNRFVVRLPLPYTASSVSVRTPWW